MAPERRLGEPNTVPETFEDLGDAEIFTLTGSLQLLLVWQNCVTGDEWLRQ
jgi:hypothetical protein